MPLRAGIFLDSALTSSHGHGCVAAQAKVRRASANTLQKIKEAMLSLALPLLGALSGHYELATPEISRIRPSALTRHRQRRASTDSGSIPDRHGRLASGRHEHSRRGAARRFAAAFAQRPVEGDRRVELVAGTLAGRSRRSPEAQPDRIFEQPVRLEFRRDESDTSQGQFGMYYTDEKAIQSVLNSKLPLLA